MNLSIANTIKGLRIYETYLKSVVQILPTNYFNTNEPTINDILLRHKTLSETNADLVKSIEYNQQHMEKEQDKLAKILREKDDTILVFNSQLGSTQKEYEKRLQDMHVKEQRQDEYYKSVKEKVFCFKTKCKAACVGRNKASDS